MERDRDWVRTSELRCSPRLSAESSLELWRIHGGRRLFATGGGTDLAAGPRHHLQLWAEVYEARFEVPRVGDADTLAYYFEAKYKFTPQLFGALRWNQQIFGSVDDGRKGSLRWGQDLGRIDAAIGYRFTSHTQLKLQYSFQHETTGPRDDNHLLAAQFTIRF